MDSRYILLQEDTNLDYEPTQEEILEEAKYLGIASEDTDLLWIAKEALRVMRGNGVEHRRPSPATGALTKRRRRGRSCTTTKRQAKCRTTIPWMSTSAVCTTR